MDVSALVATGLWAPALGAAASGRRACQHRDLLLKLIIQRPRPPLNVLHVSQPETSFGFPSGHATFYAWFIPLLVVALTPWLPRRSRLPIYVLAGLVVLIGATARVWAGAHWPTDVLGGVLLGAAWAAIAIWLVGVPRPASGDDSRLAGLSRPE